MKIFKNTKDKKLYTLTELKPGVYTAIPIDKENKTISNCELSDFVPVSNIDRIK